MLMTRWGKRQGGRRRKEREAGQRVGSEGEGNGERQTDDTENEY